MQAPSGETRGGERRAAEAPSIGARPSRAHGAAQAPGGAALRRNPVRPVLSRPFTLCDLADLAFQRTRSLHPESSAHPAGAKMLRCTLQVPSSTRLRIRIT